MKTESVWTKYSEKQLKELEKLSADYRAFLDEGKTERECVSYIVNRIENEGYVELAKLLKSGKKIKAGAKIYNFLFPRLKMTFFLQLVHYNNKKTEKSGVYEAECFTTGKA